LDNKNINNKDSYESVSIIKIAEEIKDLFNDYKSTETYGVEEMSMQSIDKVLQEYNFKDKN